MEPSGSPEEDHRESIVRFAQDMAVLRSRTGVSLHDLHRSTKISIGILEEFERSGLVDNPLFNRVYLRSFISTYASTLGVDKGTALGALDHALSGSYDGGMLSAPDDDGSSGTQVALTSSGADAEHREGEADAQASEGPHDYSDVAAAPPGASPRSVADSGDNDSPPQLGGRVYEPGVARRFRFEPIRPEVPRRSAGEQRPANAQPRNDPETPPVSKRGKRHTEISTAVRDFREPEPQKGLIIPPNRVKTIALIALVIAITVSAAILAFRLSTRTPTNDSSMDPTGTTNGEQTALVQTQPAEVEPAISVPVIGDTIIVTLVADGRPLDPVRVRVDNDLRRPYWIDTGDSLSFAMTNQIVVDSLLDATILKLEGLEYPRNAYRTRYSVVITRDSVLRFVESLNRR